MIAAISSAYMGHEVSLYEKNEKLGKKIFITGKGRCNVTNASDMKTIMDNIVSNPKFLYSSFQQFTNEDLMDLIKNEGVDLKVERGNRVFPVSDKSSDIIKALEKKLRELNVKIELYSEVDDIIVEAGMAKGIVLKGKEKIYGDAVIVATGGLSYPATGSTGDGLHWARKYGIKVTDTYPSLVPFNVKDPFARELSGLSLKNIEVRIQKKDTVLYKEFGEMLFTHFGISGPVILSASAKVGPLIDADTDLYIDFKPGLDAETLDKRILRDFEEFKNKRLHNALDKLLPKAVIPYVIRQAGVNEDLPVHTISKEARQSLLCTIKGFRLQLIGLRSYKEAIITKGGVDIKEIHPTTMESKKIKNLYFAGEVLDLDAYTGGYNLQIAWSTGYAAGGNIEYV